MRIYKGAAKPIAFMLIMLTLSALFLFPLTVNANDEIYIESNNSSNLRAGIKLSVGAPKNPTMPELNGNTVRPVSETKLSADDIAMRMYYLGYINGVSFDESGLPIFGITSNLTRLDAYIFAIRLLEEEEKAQSYDKACPYGDIPDWAKPYIAYAYHNGLLNDNNENFNPTSNASPDEFFSLMLYVLGYDFNTYDPEYALENAIKIGLTDSFKTTLTRADAVCAMWSVLRTYCRGEKFTYAEKLCDNGVLGFDDMTFFVWSENNDEFEQYVSMMGYTMTETLADGYYTITLDGSDKCLNVLAEGANSDYEGVGVTAWKSTGDITQKFRVERTEKGTYRIFSAASKGGYYRLLGFNLKKDGMALWRDTSSNAEEYFIIRNYNSDGSWFIVPSSDNTAVLTVTDGKSGNSPVAAMEKATDILQYQCWRFESQSITSQNGEEAALFPNDTLTITQGAYDTFSHGKQNAIDCVSETRYFAPFTGKITALGNGGADCNAVWFESSSKVRFADGTVDYMTVVFMHDDDISDLIEGQVVIQGQGFIDPGVEGGATGEHSHIAVYRGRNIDTEVVTGSGDVYAEDAFFVLHDTNVREPYGLNWIIMP